MAANRHKEAKTVVSGIIEGDNHADLWYFGPTFVMDHVTCQMCSVSGYDKKIQSKEIYIGTGLTLWTNPTTGCLQLLQINQELKNLELWPILININHLASLGVTTRGMSIDLFVFNVRIQIC